MEYAHKLEQLQVGSYYKVAHAECDYLGVSYYIPVIPHKHSDSAFAINIEHYHVDGRFFIPDQVVRHFEITDGKTNHPIWMTDKYEVAAYRFKRLVFKRRKCIRLNTGLSFGLEHKAGHKRFINWYNSMIGKKCEGKRCPHYGVMMLDEGTHLRCPLHDLHADKETLLVIKHPTLHNEHL